MEKLLTPEEVAEILAISVFTVKDYLRAGKITGVKIGKKWRVSPSALQEFIDENTRTKPERVKEEKKVSSLDRVLGSEIEPLTIDSINKIKEDFPTIEQLKKGIEQLKKKEESD